MKFVVLSFCLVFSVFGCAKRSVVATSPGSAGSASSDKASPDSPSASPGGTDATSGLPRGPIYFAYDDARLGEAARATLSEVGREMLRDTSRRVELEGHCDERGTTEYNLALGERRAVAARDYLLAFGVERSRLESMSFGEERPSDPAHVESAWALNRRVEIVPH